MMSGASLPPTPRSPSPVSSASSSPSRISFAALASTIFQGLPSPSSRFDPKKFAANTSYASRAEVEIWTHLLSLPTAERNEADVQRMDLALSQIVPFWSQLLPPHRILLLQTQPLSPLSMAGGAASPSKTRQLNGRPRPPAMSRLQSFARKVKGVVSESGKVARHLDAHVMTPVSLFGIEALHPAGAVRTAAVMATDTSLLMAFTAQQYHSAEAEAIASVKRVAVDILQCCPAFARWPADALAVLTVDCVLDTVGPNAVLAAQDDSANYAVFLHAGLADVKRRIAVPHKPACQLLSGQSLGLISSKTDVPIDFVAGSLRSHECFGLNDVLSTAEGWFPSESLFSLPHTPRRLPTPHYRNSLLSTTRATVLRVARSSLHHAFSLYPDLCRASASVEAAYIPSNDALIRNALDEKDWSRCKQEFVRTGRLPKFQHDEPVFEGSTRFGVLPPTVLALHEAFADTSRALSRRMPPISGDTTARRPPARKESRIPHYPTFKHPKRILREAKVAERREAAALMMSPIRRRPLFKFTAPKPVVDAKFRKFIQADPCTLSSIVPG